MRRIPCPSTSPKCLQPCTGCSATYGSLASNGTQAWPNIYLQWAEKLNQSPVESTWRTAIGSAGIWSGSVRRKANFSTNNVPYGTVTKPKKVYMICNRIFFPSFSLHLFSSLSSIVSLVFLLDHDPLGQGQGFGTGFCFFPPTHTLLLL